MTVSLALKFLTVPPFMLFCGIMGAFLIAVLLYVALESLVLGAWNWLTR